MIAPDGVAVCGTLGASTQAELDAWLRPHATAKSAREPIAPMNTRKLVPWFVLAIVVIAGVVVLVVRSRPEQLARGACRPARAPARVPGVRGSVGRRQQLAAVPGDPRRHPAPDRRRPVRRRDPGGYVSRYTEKILETPSNSGLGIVAWGLPALAVILGAASISSRCAAGAVRPRLTATDEDEDVVRQARGTAAEPDRRMSDDPADHADTSTRRARRARGRARLPAALARRSRGRAASPATSTPTPTASARRLHRARVGGHPVARRRRRAAVARADHACRPRCAVLTFGGIVVFAVHRRGPARAHGRATAARTADHRRRAVRRHARPPPSPASVVAAAKAAAAAQPKSYDAQISYAARAPVGRCVLGGRAGVHRGREARPDPGRAARVHGLADGALRSKRDRLVDAEVAPRRRVHEPRSGDRASIRPTLTRMSSRGCC